MLKHQTSFLGSLIFLFVSAGAWANPPYGGRAGMINPGKVACEQKWAKDLKKYNSVRFGFEYYDTKGNPMRPPHGAPQGQFCSGSVVRVGPNKELKFVTAAHCLKADYRKVKKGPKDENPLKKEINFGEPPISTYNFRIGARIGDSKESLLLSSFAGPIYKPGNLKEDPMETFRADDFAFADADPGILTEKFAKMEIRNPIEVPEICPSNLNLKDIENRIVAIGYGVTKDGKNTPTPVCIEPTIAYMSKGVIVSHGRKEEGSTPCLGDSGGGLWALPSGIGAKPCMLGVVSGVKSNSLKGKAPPLPPGAPPEMAECLKIGSEPMYSSLVHQQERVDSYLSDASGGTAQPPKDGSPGSHEGAL